VKVKLVYISAIISDKMYTTCGYWK